MTSSSTGKEGVQDLSRGWRTSSSPSSPSWTIKHSPRKQCLLQVTEIDIVISKWSQRIKDIFFMFLGKMSTVMAEGWRHLSEWLVCFYSSTSRACRCYSLGPRDAPWFLCWAPPRFTVELKEETRRNHSEQHKDRLVGMGYPTAKHMLHMESMNSLWLCQPWVTHVVKALRGFLHLTNEDVSKAVDIRQNYSSVSVTHEDNKDLKPRLTQNMHSSKVREWHVDCRPEELKAE